MLPTGDTNYCSREQRKPCKYIISGQPCPFGRRCRYEHSLHASDANGTFCNQGGSSGEVSRVSAVSQTRDTPLLDFVSFPTLKNSASRAAVLVPSAPLASSSTVDKRPIAGRQRPFVRESGGPPELTLEQFFNKAISLQPRQAVVRPTPRQSGEGLRDVELQQMKARFPEDQCQLVERSRDKDVYRLKFSPLDPQWKFAFRTVDLVVTFPSNYPTTIFSVDVPGDQTLSPKAAASLKLAIHKYLTGQASGGRDLPLRPFLRWLENNIYSIVAVEVEQNPLQPIQDPLQRIQDPLQPTQDPLQRIQDPLQPTQDPLQPIQDPLQPTQDTLQPIQDPLPLCADKDNHTPSMVVNPVPVKRGTEVRFQELKLSTTVATVIFERIKLVVVCGRCREMCSTAIIHATNATCGFLDLEGCTAIDMVLQDSIATITCLECANSLSGTSMAFGEQRDWWCRRCHANLSLLSSQCHLVQHQTGPVAKAVPQTTPTQKGNAMKDLTVQVGKPLPQFGTCKHYKKSSRWLRFPCCGKAYPCDLCHDSAEDHPMERAKRMLCGYCASEQPYTTDGPCTKCGSDLTNIKSSGFWEGGTGCRSKVKMNRNDKHKYSNMAKTTCKKQERVGGAK